MHVQLQKKARGIYHHINVFEIAEIRCLTLVFICSLKHKTSWFSKLPKPLIYLQAEYMHKRWTAPNARLTTPRNPPGLQGHAQETQKLGKMGGRWCTNPYLTAMTTSFQEGPGSCAPILVKPESRFSRAPPRSAGAREQRAGGPQEPGPQPNVNSTTSRESSLKEGTGVGITNVSHHASLRCINLSQKM